MELIHYAFVLTIVCLVSATPNGYGTKGGASAKAEAGAAAFSGLGGIPVAIPNGAGFSGSFSKSSASSFASSSASSSSSSFSYNGAGSTALSGANGAALSNGGCASGACQNSDANGLSIGSLGSSNDQNRIQAYSGAKAAAVAGVGPSGGCASGTCDNAGTGGLSTGSLNLENNEKKIQANSATDDAAASGVGASDGCTSGTCQNGVSNGISTNSLKPNNNGNGAQTYSDSKATTASEVGTNGGCVSGTCQNGGANGISSGSFNLGINRNGVETYNGAKAASGSGIQPGSTSPKNVLPSCNGGQCATQNTGASGCEGSKCNIANPDKDCANGRCSPTSQSTAPSIEYGFNDIPVNIQSTYGSKTTSYNAKNQPAGYDRATVSSPDCSHGYCGTPSSSKSPTYVPAPATFLTTPKEVSSQNSKCNSPNCDSLDVNINPGTGNLPLNYNVPAYNTYPGSLNEEKAPGCTSENCQQNVPLTTPNSNSLSTSYLNPSHTEHSGPTGSKCTSPNCSGGTYNIDSPNVPNTQVPFNPIPSGSVNCATGDCANYPSTQSNIGIGNDYSGAKIPSYSHGASPYTPTAAGFPPIKHGEVPPTLISTNPIYLQAGLPSYNRPSTSNILTNCGTSNCDAYPSGNTGATTGATSASGAFGLSPPSGTIVPTSQKLPVYTGGFGGSSGILKPNEFTLPAKPSYTQQHFTSKPTYPSGTVLVPTSPINIPSVPAGTSNPVSCTTGNCGSQTGHSSPNYHIQNGSVSSTNAASSATAAANAVSYSGGFGGPPGFLKPYDYNKVGTAVHGHGNEHIGSSQTGANSNVVSGSVPSYGKSSLGTNNGPETGLGTQAIAAAQASSGAFSGSNNLQNSLHGQNGLHGSEKQGEGGCSGGCDTDKSGSYGGGTGFGLGGGLGLSSGLGLSKTGILDGLGGGLNAAGSVAKSLAGAVSGAGSGSFGLGGSFASSVASAHSSSGAATKGGYGKR